MGHHLQLSQHPPKPFTSIDKREGLESLSGIQFILLPRSLVLTAPKLNPYRPRRDTDLRRRPIQHYQDRKLNEGSSKTASCVKQADPSVQILFVPFALDPYTEDGLFRSHC